MGGERFERDVEAGIAARVHLDHGAVVRPGQIIGFLDVHALPAVAGLGQGEPGLGASVDGAEAQAQLASAQLQRHRVTAPFPGVVSERYVDAGDWVTPGVRVLDLVRTDTVELRVDAPLDLARRVSVGDPVQVGDGAGVVVGVVQALDPVTRTAPIRIEPSGTGNWIPGTLVDVVFDVAASGGVIVPRDAVVQGAVDERVFRVDENTAAAVVVEVIASTETDVLVRTDELRAGDRVVVRGNERLRPGQAVSVTP